jgi:hypothetical protein
MVISTGVNIHFDMLDPRDFFVDYGLALETIGIVVNGEDASAGGGDRSIQFLSPKSLRSHRKSPSPATDEQLADDIADRRNGL